MTGSQLLKILTDQSGKLNYEVLIGIGDIWVKLESIKFDTALKTIDLSFDGRNNRCTGYLDQDSLQHDGDTCPLHEGRNDD